MQGSCTECRAGLCATCWGIDLCGCTRDDCETGEANRHALAARGKILDPDPLKVQCACEGCIRLRTGRWTTDGT